MLGEFLCDTASLKVKVGLTLMANLGHLCLFSNLITIHIQWCDSWVSVVGTAFFYWFQGHNLLGNDQNFKMGGSFKKVENQISSGESFSFLSIKTYITFCSCYSCFSRYYTKKEMPGIKLKTALLF